MPRRSCRPRLEVEFDDETYRVRPLSGDYGKLPIENCSLQILERCRRFSPIVGLEPTDNASILLDITGLAHLFGGEAALCEAIVGDFGRLGLSIRVAVADTIGSGLGGGAVSNEGQSARSEGQLGRRAGGR